MSRERTIEEAMVELWPFIFGDLEKLKTLSEDWLSVLSMPLRNSIDSEELAQLLNEFGSEFSSQGHAELVNLLNPVTTTRRATIPAIDIKPSKVNWLVPNILKESSLHLLGGDPNAGKSFLSIELASQISRGGELFGHKVQAGKVILFGSEDNASDTVIPRLLTQGADLNNIFIYNEEESFKFPEDLNKLYYEVAMIEPKLVVIDTVNSFIGQSTDTNSDKSVRHALQPLKKVADYYRTSILLVTHKNKGNNSNPLYSINGSIAYTGLVRLVWLLATDPDTEEKIFSVVKNNIGNMSSHKFELDFSDLSEFNQPKLIYRGETEELAHEVGQDIKTDPRTKVDECCNVILESLETAGGRQKSSALEQRILNDYTNSTYRRARKQLENSKSIRNDKSSEGWYVELLE